MTRQYFDDGTGTWRDGDGPNGYEEDNGWDDFPDFDDDETDPLNQLGYVFDEEDDDVDE